MNRLLLIRHGSTDMLGSVLCGRMPGVGLSAAGQQEARALADSLRRRESLHAVVSSPLQRARETAEIIAAPQQVKVTVDDRLQEVEFGEWTGKTFAELSDHQSWRAYNQSRMLHHAPGGESFFQVQARAMEFLNHVFDRGDGMVVAAVTHSDFVRALLTACLGMPLDYLLRLTVDPASVTELLCFADGIQVQCVNWRPRE
jgi:broad specificity phosphatase PhoE